jgi:hypothetical protein
MRALRPYQSLPKPRIAAGEFAVRSHDDLPNDVIVVKKTSNSEGGVVPVPHGTCNLPDTLNSQLLITVTW